jgi:hypothetical protein
LAPGFFVWEIAKRASLSAQLLIGKNQIKAVPFTNGTNFFVEPSESTTSISTSSGEGSADGVTWVNSPVAQMVPSGITTVLGLAFYFT